MGVVPGVTLVTASAPTGTSSSASTSWRFNKLYAPWCSSEGRRPLKPCSHPYPFPFGTWDPPAASPIEAGICSSSGFTGSIPCSSLAQPPLAAWQSAPAQDPIHGSNRDVWISGLTGDIWCNGSPLEVSDHSHYPSPCRGASFIAAARSEGLDGIPLHGCCGGLCALG